MSASQSEPQNLTKEQIGLEAINECLDQVPIACGGQISLESYDQIGGKWLVALTKEEEMIRSHLPIPASSSKALHSSGVPSSFGKGKENVYDESIRLAREFTAEKFSLAFDPLHYSTGVMKSIESFTKKSLVYAVRSKMAIYQEGGFFHGHQDTPKSEDHIGTIVICLPSAFAGGEFLLINDRKGEEKKQSFDWGTTASEGSAKLSWIFFYSDTGHEINPVKSGYRITVQYDVYQGYPDMSLKYYEDEEDFDYGPPSPVAKNQMMDVDAFSDLKTTIEKTIFDPSFFPDGGKLTWAFDHSYPHRTIPPLTERETDYYEEKDSAATHDVEFKSHLPSRLKGTDFILYHALQDLGFDVSLLAVWNDTNWKDEEDGEWWQDQDLLTADSFVLPGLDLDECYTSKKEMIEDCSPETFDQEKVIWCKKPTTFMQVASYAAFGNSVDLRHLYVSGAFQITLPPAAKRVLKRK